MPRSLRLLLRRRLFWLALLLVVWLLCSGQAQARPLGDRSEALTQWPARLAQPEAKGDSVDSGWMQGTWAMTSPLINLAALLAPAIVTG